jgi:hypothetical protein
VCVAREVVYVEIMLIARPHTSTQVQLGPRMKERESKSTGAKFVSKRAPATPLGLDFDFLLRYLNNNTIMHGMALCNYPPVDVMERQCSVRSCFYYIHRQALQKKFMRDPY